MTNPASIQPADEFRALTKTFDALLVPTVRRLHQRAVETASVGRSNHRRRQRRIGVLAVLLGVLGTGTAVAGFGTSIRLGGLEIDLGKRTNTPPVLVTIPDTSSEWPGEPVTESEAKRRYKARIRLPRLLPGPRALYWMTPPSTGTITAVWSPSRTLPQTSDPKVGLLFSQFVGSADINPVVLKKSIASGTTFAEVKIGKLAGRWISGPAHSIEIVDDSGTRAEPPRLAGNTLVWFDGTYTYRLEGNVSKALALRIARSVR